MAAGGVSKVLFVAAIDFGTTYSGYAFASKADLDKKRKEGPLAIHSNIWNGSRSLMSHKAPTALLLKPDKSFRSFGYDAENDYTELAQENEHEDYYFFHRFKMVLHNNPNLRRDTEVKDLGGKSLHAIDVFAHSIRFLKNHLFDAINNQIGGQLRKDDIMYVLTVPAIWDDKAKQFMREAAQQGGISGDQLMIALEPEAASIHCQHIPIGKNDEDAVYMVVDLGGGTADITVHQRSREDGESTLKEVHQATGGAYGGKSVDDAFQTFIGEIIGPEKLETLQKDSMEDYIDIFREFENKKRNVVENQSKVCISFPLALITLVKSDKKLKSMENAIKQCRHAEFLGWAHQRLQLPGEEFRKLFRPTTDGILKHMETIFYDSRFQHVEHIIMVGGFSECELVQNAIQNRFTLKRIIIPDEPGLAVLKGAVLFGHKPRTIRCRVARYTYGIQQWPTFSSGYHREDKKVDVNGVNHCKDVFFTYIEKGQQVTPGHRESQIFQPLRPDEETLQCFVYISNKQYPQYVDEEGCQLLGILTVPLERSGTEIPEIEETLVFGETELFVKARDVRSGREYEAQFNLL